MINSGNNSDEKDPEIIYEVEYTGQIMKKKKIWRDGKLYCYKTYVLHTKLLDCII